MTLLYQARANTAWGLAVLGHLNPAFFLKLRRLTLGSLRRTLSAELQQLYQVEMILGLEAPNLGLDTSHILHYEALLAGTDGCGFCVGRHDRQASMGRYMLHTCLI